MSPRPQKPISPSYLRNLARWYLERFDGPRAHVRRVLLVRVDRAVKLHGQDREACTRMVDELLDELVRNGAIDDHRYAVARVSAMRERGRSSRQIQMTLLQKGVSSDLIADALGEVDEGPSADRVAAIRYARRRRFGPWRRGDAAHDKRLKELASMARAGFDFGVAKQVLDAEDADALEDELPRGW